MPKIHTNVMITAENIAIPALLHDVGPPSCHMPARTMSPMIISFHIKAMMKPKAAAIAVDMLIFTSLNLTILSLATPKLLLSILPLLLRFSIFHTYF